MSVVESFHCRGISCLDNRMYLKINDMLAMQNCRFVHSSLEESYQNGSIFFQLCIEVHINQARFNSAEYLHMPRFERVT